MLSHKASLCKLNYTHDCVRNPGELNCPRIANGIKIDAPTQSSVAAMYKM